MAGVAPMPPSAATWASDLQAKVGHREEAQALEANGEAYTARVPVLLSPLLFLAFTIRSQRRSVALGLSRSTRLVRPTLLALLCWPPTRLCSC